MGLWGAIMAGYGAFRAAMLNADTLRDGVSLGEYDSWGHYEARKFRFALAWSLYQANTYRDDMHPWAAPLKSEFDLYPATRSIHNPVKQLGDFWASHLWPGDLDPAAGDGEGAPSALPILTDNAAIRPAIAQLWKDSHWRIRKADLALKGGLFGDVGIKVCDDPDRRRAVLQVIHPGHVKWARHDPRQPGRLIEYILEEVRYDPRSTPVQDGNPMVDPSALRRVTTYHEEAWAEGGRVWYRTYLDGAPFDWTINPATGQPYGTGPEARPEWSVPYGFIPLVLIKHQDIGIEWGMGEVHPLISKVFEADDAASNAGDYIRKALKGPWYVEGAKAGQVSITGAVDAAGNPRAPSVTIPLVFGPVGSKVTPMLYPLDITAVNARIDAVRDQMREDYPELQVDIWKTGDPSGRAIRLARQRVETKVQERRVGYDAGMVAIQRMALALASAQGYEGYQGLPTDPDDPGLEHSIGKRNVFIKDPADDLEDDKLFWEAAAAATKAGCPLAYWLEGQGWDAKRIAAFKAAKEAEAPPPPPPLPPGAPAAPMTPDRAGPQQPEPGPTR